jgi:hypothetical protein
MPVLREPGPLRLPPDFFGAGLPDLLEPYLWLDEITPVQLIGASALTAGARYRWLQIQGTVKMPARWQHDPVPDGYAERCRMARRVRDALHHQAERAIDAAGKAGWHHERHPETEITGQLIRRGEKPAYLRAEARVRLWLTR